MITKVFTKRSPRFWMFLIGAVVIPLAGVALDHALDNASRATQMENELNTQRDAITYSDVHLQLTDLRGALVEVYARVGEDDLPEAYWEAVELARSARLNLADGDLDQALLNIASSYEKIYSIPLPVGPPVIHDESISSIIEF